VCLRSPHAQLGRPIPAAVQACERIIRELYNIEGFRDYFYRAVDPVQLRNPLRAAVLDSPQNLGMVLHKVRS
jgi:hypothetical protein